MKNSKIKLANEKICGICLKPIDDRDDYYLMQSYQFGKYLGRQFYHWRCFMERLNKIDMVKQIEQSNGNN